MQLEKTKYSDSIKPLDKQVIVSEEPIPPTNWVWCIVGKKGTGKSTLVYSLLDSKLRNKYDMILLCSQTYRNDMYSKDILRDLVEELEPANQVFDDIDDEIAGEIISKLQKTNDRAREKGKKARNLLILDDCLSSLPRNKNKSNINKFWVNHRHYNLDCVIISQKYNALPTLLRQNTSIISLFGSNNKKDVEAILNDLDIDPQLFKDLYHFAVDNPNSFLHINLTGSEPIFYKKFDKIICYSK